MDKNKLHSLFNTVQAILEELIQRDQAGNHHLTFITLEGLVCALGKLRTFCIDADLGAEFSVSLAENDFTRVLSSDFS